jgi:hypothetical protein
MNIRIASLGVVAALMASSAALADGRVHIDINPFGWGAPPPVVYESPRYYAPPPVVYYGRGDWGEHREGRGRDHDRNRGREHHDDGDRRR